MSSMARITMAVIIQTGTLLKVKAGFIYNDIGRVGIKQMNGHPSDTCRDHRPAKEASTWQPCFILITLPCTVQTGTWWHLSSGRPIPTLPATRGRTGCELALVILYLVSAHLFPALRLLSRNLWAHVPILPFWPISHTTANFYSRSVTQLIFLMDSYKRRKVSIRFHEIIQEYSNKVFSDG